MIRSVKKPLVEITIPVSYTHLDVYKRQTIYWQWLAMTDVVDEQRNQLLWELIWTVVVRAVGHDGRHTICIVESTDEVV